MSKLKQRRPSLIASRCVRQVVGIDINDSAVVDARINASMNCVENCEFFCAKVG